MKRWSLDARNGDHTSRLLNTGKELSPDIVWPVSLVPPVAPVSRHGPWPLSYEHEGQGHATAPVLPLSLA
jgi:hypothetical protein